MLLDELRCAGVEEAVPPGDRLPPQRLVVDAIQVRPREERGDERFAVRRRHDGVLMFAVALTGESCRIASVLAPVKDRDEVPSLALTEGGEPSMLLEAGEIGRRTRGDEEELTLIREERDDLFCEAPVLGPLRSLFPFLLLPLLPLLPLATNTPCRCIKYAATSFGKRIATTKLGEELREIAWILEQSLR